MPGASTNTGRRTGLCGDSDCRLRFIPEGWQRLAGRLSAAIPPDRANPEHATPAGVADSCMEIPAVEFDPFNVAHRSESVG